jgi:ADP-dependent NAD(P)H-hydrate dehydratase / NAD(P)H-hydrate epimerase
MRSAHTVEQVRAAEAELMARLPDGTLMQRAATGLAVAISNFLGGTYGARVVLLIGSGDNGGDALYAGAYLARRGAQVTAILLSPKAHEAGTAALRTAGGRTITSAGDISGEIYDGIVREIARADVVVDGIVGIGGRPGLRPDALAAVQLA